MLSALNQEFLHTWELYWGRGIAQVIGNFIADPKAKYFNKRQEQKGFLGQRFVLFPLEDDSSVFT